MKTLQFLIPPASLAAVENALQEAFQTTAVKEIVLLTGGLSGSGIYKMMVNDIPYVLKLGSSSGSMAIAAKAGIAPPVYYFNKAEGIAITGFIEGTPQKAVSPTKIARTIKRIHELPSFPDGNSLVNTVDGVIAQFDGPGFQDGLTYYAEIRKNYPWDDTDKVPSHNDLNPGNIIYEGGNIWIIDWDGAHQNDRYVDLAIAANFYVAGDDQENTFLKAYFGNDLTNYHKARFFLMRQVCRIVYGILLYKHGSLGETLLNSALDDMRSLRFADEMNKIADI